MKTRALRGSAHLERSFLNFWPRAVEYAARHFDLGHTLGRLPVPAYRSGFPQYRHFPTTSPFCIGFTFSPFIG